MAKNDIPKRIYKIWQTPLDIDTCEGLLSLHKLQCSTCNQKFDSEVRFAIHIEKCMENAERDINYQVHQHANRLLMYTHRVALFCGASQQKEYLECGICKQSFQDKAAIRKHIKSCARYNNDYGTFIRNTKALFSNMLYSHEKLGQLFQKYVSDEHIIAIKQKRRLRSIRGEKPHIGSPGKHLFFDELSEHFIEKYQDYLFAVCALIDDAFIRYLKKKELDSITRDICYSLPTKRRRTASGKYEDDESDDEDLEVKQKVQVEASRKRKRSCIAK